MSRLTEQEYNLIHPIVAIEEAAASIFHATCRDGEEMEIVAETIVEALMIAETPDGLVVPEEKILASLNLFWLTKVSPYVGDPVVFALMASIEERIDASEREQIESLLRIDRERP